MNTRQSRTRALTSLRVVYVVGKGRSGSTLLDDMLGSLDGVASLGEVRRLWDRFDEPTYTCTCGMPVPDCAVWGPSVWAVTRSGTTVREVAAAQASVHSWWRLPVLAAGHQSPRVREFAEALGRLYSEVARRTGSATLIDSSKWPGHIGLLGMIPGVEPWVIQLVRDPRAVAFSYTRVRSGTGQLQMPRFGPLHSALSWNARNIVAGYAMRRVSPRRARLVRYEDLVEDPRGSVERLGAWLGVSQPTAAFRDERTLHLGPAHLVGGNPRRLERGDVEIRPDEAWRREAGSAATRTVARLTAPLRRRYGYEGD